MLARRGQTIVEYTIIIGIVAVVLSYMGTGIKRSMQSLVKVTADQVGNQQNADQDFNDTAQGYMIATTTQMQQNKAKQHTDVYYVTNSSFNESSSVETKTMTNGGFTPSS